MALMDENGGGLVPTMPVAPAYSGGCNNGMGFGGDWAWIILLLLLGWGGNGYGNGGFGGGYDFPWLLNGQNGINENVNNGFRDAMINDGIASIRDGIGNLSTQLCGCCSDTQMAIANGFANAETAASNRQMANMQQGFGIQTAITGGLNNVSQQLSQCCCDNRAATQDVKYTIATEACANRATSTANTQAILDKLCQIELDNAKSQIDAKNDTIAQLRQEVLYARGQASQDVQTARILQGQNAEVDALYNRLDSCPVGTTPVYGRTPIFTCNGNNGCGCGCNM